MINDMSLKRPCNDCPFRKEGGLFLHKERIKEIGAIATNDLMTFTCHKTLEAEKKQHCAGAMIFAEKHNRPTVAMRLAAMWEIYNPEEMLGHDEVWESLDQWLEHVI